MFAPSAALRWLQNIHWTPPKARRLQAPREAGHAHVADALSMRKQRPSQVSSGSEVSQATSRSSATYMACAVISAAQEQRHGSILHLSL